MAEIGYGQKVTPRGMGGRADAHGHLGRGALPVKSDEERDRHGEALPVYFPTNWEGEPPPDEARGPNRRRPSIAS